MNGRGRTRRRNGTVYSIFIVSRLPASERQRHRSRDAVVGYMLDYGANQPTAVALPELLPLRFRDMELLAGLLAAQCALDVGHDGLLDQDSRNRLGGTGVPSVLQGLLANVLTKPPTTLGR